MTKATKGLATKSISTSITRLVFGMALIITLLYSLLVIAYAWVIEDNIFNRLVNAEARHIEATYLTDARVIQPKASFMRLHDNWSDLPDEIYPVWKTEPQRVEFTLNNGQTLHIEVLTLGNQQYILSADVAKYEVTKDFMSDVTLWLGVFALLCCLLVSLSAWWYARRQMRPMEKLVNALEQLNQKTMQPGFAEGYPDNEVRLLASTIENQFLALDAALQRETHFTRDVSHEIRTPISIQKNILEKHQQTKSLSEQELATLRETSYQLESVTHTLLALARDESTQTIRLNLSEILENVILSHFELNNTAKGQALELDLDLQKEVWVEANQQLMEILFQNLISNAVQYAAQSPIIITLAKNKLCFENGYEQAPPELFWEAGTRGEKSRGIGQGLHLIERICETVHWKLSATAHDGLFSLVIVFD